MVRNPSSNKSKLVQIFVQRAGSEFTSADAVMLKLVTELRKPAKAKTGRIAFDRYLALRNVREVTYEREPGFEGKIEPLGSSHQDGYRVALSRSAPASRNRFTLAHEICHTFFYEVVPEIKFSPQQTDPSEERLCNLGAAELLMPANVVKREARYLPICLDALYALSTLFRVSNEAMALRLIELDIWEVQLSSWLKLTNGKFAIERCVGGSIKDWEWPAPAQMEEALKSGTPSSGHQFLVRHCQGGAIQGLSVRFDLKARGSRICMLWGKGVVGSQTTKILSERAGEDAQLLIA